MTQETVEVARIKLSSSNTKKVRSMTAAVTDFQSRYGKHALGVAAYEDEVDVTRRRLVREGASIRGALQEATFALREFSTDLTSEMGVDLDDGQWTLDVEAGCFIQTRAAPQQKTKSKKQKSSKLPAKSASKKRRPRGK